MRILLCNDDGYFAPGIEHLARVLADVAEITVVAPERDRSGASNSLTLDRPLSLKRAANGFYHVNGTPTDCVHLAVTGMLDGLPDMVVSGINMGANMGDDTIYSGTVAAATEGFLLGIPSLAISLCGTPGEYFSSAAQVARELVEMLRGTRVTRLGRRHKAEPAVKSITPRNETVYWVGAAGPAADAGEGTDFHAVENGWVSVTPLQIDLTHNAQLAAVTDWVRR